MARPVKFTLTADEALVLFEWIHRLEDGDMAELGVVHPAEQRALLRLSGALESTLVASFANNYADAVAQARARLADN